MLYTSENNWVTWRYDNGPTRSRSVSPSQTFQIVYTKTDASIGTLWEEHINAAKSIIDHYPNLKINLFFSGGVDSEMMVRAFLHIGVKPNVFVVRYEDDINIYDVSYAIAISNSLGIDIKIIDMNLKKFFETEAEKISEIAQCDRPRLLPQLKFADFVDGLAIVAMGDLAWQRLDDDYTKPGKWVAWDFEHDFACDRYNLETNRTAIYQWPKWTPGLFLAHTKTKWFTNLITDKFLGKIGNSSTKMQGFKEAVPDLIPRKKKIGFEDCENLISEFDDFLYKKYNGHPFRRFEEFTLDEIYNKITGHGFTNA